MQGYENYAIWPDPVGRARGDHGGAETRTGFDRIGSIIAYECGELSDEDTLILFAHLIRTGRAWSLQGFYGRAATQLINAGYISPEGDIL